MRLVLLLLSAFLTAAGQEWPRHAHDRSRSGATAEFIPAEAVELWRHRSPAAPAPAWPAPASGSFWQRLERIRARVVDDRVFQPIGKDQLLYYGSSSSDEVTCLDVASGLVRWRFPTEGPVRFAPEIAGEALVFASDDGYVYSLERLTGALNWKRLVAPDQARLPGNGRFISSHPPRCGVLVDAGVVYATAGLFPARGCFAFALSLADGQPIWRVPLSDRSPQGYLLATSETLFVPTGRTSPFGLDRATGKLRGSFGGPGGSYAILADEGLVSGPGDRGELGLQGAAKRERLATFKGHRMVVSRRHSYLLGERRLSALDRSRRLELTAERQGWEARRRVATKKRDAATPDSAERPGIEAELARCLQGIEACKRNLEKCILWSREVEHDDAVILAGDRLVLGGRDGVTLLSSTDGRVLQSIAVEGRALGLAAWGGRLFVMTDAGTLYAFGAKPDARSVAAAVDPIETPTDDAAAEPALAATAAFCAGRLPGSRGYALVLDDRDGNFAVELARVTELEIVVAASDDASFEALRRRRRVAGLDAARMTVVRSAGDELPSVDHLFNLIVSVSAFEDDRSRPARKEILRLLRPAGGVLLVGGPKARPSELGTWLEGFPGDHHREVIADPTGHWAYLDRRALIGAGDWTHAYADAGNSACSGDDRVGLDLRLQWFGGPGPEPMIDRHLRTAPPLVSEGRLVIPAFDRLIAVDAYNGVRLWEHAASGLSRTGFPYDGGYIALGAGSVHYAVGDGCMTRDLVTGQEGRHHRLPAAADGRPREWGWVATVGGHLFGSGQLDGAARRDQSRTAVVDQYAVQRPLVTSKSVFCRSVESGAELWRHEDGVIANTSLTLGGGRLYMLESRETKAVADDDGRVALRELLGSSTRIVALDAGTGAKIWDRPFAPPDLRHSLFLAYAKERLIVVGCGDQNGRNHYELRVFDAARGEELWTARHENNRGGTAGNHGEQVHHPVIRADTIVAEPLVYELETGRVLDKKGDEGAIYLAARNGCGTISASSSCVFYRNRNPVGIDFSQDSIPRPLTRISRPGCWINIIPAGGLVVIPEASSGCVCSFSLQTSMALAPVN